MDGGRKGLALHFVHLPASTDVVLVGGHVAGFGREDFLPVVVAKPIVRAFRTDATTRSCTSKRSFHRPSIFSAAIESPVAVSISVAVTRTRSPTRW